MKQKSNSGGRPPKINATVFRCSVNFTEKKAMAVLAKLERQTIELVKTNREIVALARQIDELWHKET